MLSKMFLHGVAAAAVIAIAAGLYAASALETPPLGDVASAPTESSTTDTGYHAAERVPSRRSDIERESRNADKRADHERRKAHDDDHDDDHDED